MENINFKELKKKVGVDDIAYSLGYRLDRSAGVGKFIEMSLPDGRGGVSDTIVIRNPKNKAEQTFFHRNYSGGGDVIRLIEENINGFNISGRDTWDTIRRVMAKFADEPIPDYGDSKYLVKAGYVENQVFDPKRWEVLPAKSSMHHVMSYFEPRGIKQETVNDFAPFLFRIRDLQSTTYNNYNLGFPYTKPDSGEVTGYEIRGYKKFKSKAPGTNSTSAAWIVDMSGSKNPLAIKNVFFAESAYDIMAFYQFNRQKLEKESSVFVSLGGTFADQQIKGIMRHYADARAVDCFDNDLAGRIYGIRMAGLMEGVNLNLVKSDNFVQVTVDGKEHRMAPEKASIQELTTFMELKSNIGEWKPAKAFKDWNDQVMNKPIEQMVLPNKYQRNEKLAEDRAKGMKL